MASIVISDLRPVGSEFFSDSENYLDEVSGNDMLQVSGGISPTFFVAPALIVSGAGISFAVGYFSRK